MNGHTLADNNIWELITEILIITSIFAFPKVPLLPYRPYKAFGYLGSPAAKFLSSLGRLPIVPRLEAFLM